MARSSKWAANPEMWQYAAALVRGGKTYAQVEALLAREEVTKQFGLLEVPHRDTIRYQIKQQGLLEQKRLPSSLFPEDLKAHQRALSYLALILRGQASVPDTSGTGSIAEGGQPDRWTGFLPGFKNVFGPEDHEEHEVYDQWDSGTSDPRELSHFEFLIEHLDFSIKGKRIVRRITSVFEKAEEFSDASAQLWNVLNEDLAAEFEIEPGSPDLERRCKEIFDALHPTSGLPEGKKSLRLRISVDPAHRPIKRGDFGTPEVFRIRRGGSEHKNLVNAWKKLDEVAWELERALTPSSRVRRLVQDGQCSICALSNE